MSSSCPSGHVLYPGRKAYSRGVLRSGNIKCRYDDTRCSGMCRAQPSARRISITKGLTRKYCRVILHNSVSLCRSAHKGRGPTRRRTNCEGEDNGNSGHKGKPHLSPAPFSLGLVRTNWRNEFAKRFAGRRGYLRAITAARWVARLAFTGDFAAFYRYVTSRRDARAACD